jgi:hypothetical protein
MQPRRMNQGPGHEWQEGNLQSYPSDIFRSLIDITPISYLEYFLAERIDVLCQDRERSRHAKDGEGLDREPVHIVNDSCLVMVERGN